MLKDNIKAAREAKGLSQEELAIKLHAVRQTISKWERGLSVPDADMLISISEIFDLPVSALLGEKLPVTKADSLKTISEKLEVINLQLAERRKAQIKVLRWALILPCLVIIVVTVVLFLLGGQYADWNYNNPETAVLDTAVHSVEWLFVRIAPLIFLASIIGIISHSRKNNACACTSRTLCDIMPNF